MEYTAQNLEYAVSVFYNGEQTERTRAHTWLTAAQRVPEAWKFVWELLQPNKGTEIQFYAATTLHTKILRCWHELPLESHDELKEKILQAINAYSKGPKIVTNRLCISLAAFILQQGTLDLAAILQPLSTLENTSLLLEVLTVIPEEYNSMTMGSSLRAKNRAALQQACPAVLDDMLRCLQAVYNDYSANPPSESTVSSWVLAATCACSWLTLGGEGADDAAAPGGALPDRLPLCRAMLRVVEVLVTWNEAVSDTALEACEACLSGVRAAGGGAAAARHPAAALELFAALADTAAPIMQRDNVPNSINEELLSALVTCCVCIVECHSQTVVTAVQAEPPNQPARQLVELLLAAQAAPGHYPLHETRSNLVFGAWYTLQDEILNVMELDGGAGEGEGECDGGRGKVSEVWRCVFSRLLGALVTKSEAHDAALGRDDQELLRCYRQDIADTVMYCYGVLGEWCWSTVEAAWGGAAAGAAGAMRREAALHVLCALADAAPVGRAPPALLTMLQHAVEAAETEQDQRTLATALDCLGAYASWLSTVESVALRGLCERMVVAAGGALGRAAPAAARALRRLCADCAAPAANLVADIVHVATSPMGGMESWTRRQLVMAAGAALAAAAPAVAEPLLQALAMHIDQLLREQAAHPLGGGCGAECAAALAGSLGARPPLAARLLAALAPALPAFAQHPDLVEPMFNILRQAVAALVDQCVPMADALAQLTAAGFETRPTVGGLDHLKLLVLTLDGSWPATGRLTRQCVAASARTVAVDPAAAPDLTEALFALLLALTKKKPHFVDWIEDLLPELVDLGVTCLRLWSGGAMRAACGWLGALAAARPAHLQPRAPALTAAALTCIGGLTPRNQIEPLAELLLALNRASWEPTSEQPAGVGAAGGGLAGWLRRALAVNGFPTAHATDQHKHKFIAAVIKEKSSKRRLLETVQEFSLVCRGLVGTEYARQTLAAKQLVA